VICVRDLRCIGSLASLTRYSTLTVDLFDICLSNTRRHVTPRYLQQSSITSDDSIAGFQFRYNIFANYRNIDIDIFLKNTKYVNFIQAQEKDVNIEQGSMLYAGTKMCR